MLISTGIELRNDAESVAARLPTNHEMRIISIEEARELFGDGATLVDGVTVSEIPLPFVHVEGVFLIPSCLLVDDE